MEYTVKILLGFFIGALNLLGLCFTLLALYSVIVIARMPRTSSIYIMAASNLTVDAVQLLLGLIYLTPSVILNSFLLPGDREGQPVIFLGSIFMFCWYYGSISQVLVAVSRLIVVCFPQYDIFTTQRVLIMVIGLYPVAVGLSITAQYILHCCNFSFNHIVLSYTYLEFSNGFNYSNAYIDLWMNSLSSGICFLCYTAIIIYVIRMNKVSENSLNAEQRYKRRMKEYRYALQFSAISLFYFFAWTFFRIFPQYITAEDSLNWFAVISICVAINCSANALIYLFINYEVQNIIKSKIFQRGSIHMESDAQPQQKHKWAILYKGYNDQPLEQTSVQNEISDVRVARVKKGKGLIDEEEEKAAAAAAPGQTKEQVQLLFREQACSLSDSVTDRENDHEEEKQTKKLHAPPPTDKAQRQFNRLNSANEESGKSNNIT